ncbi:uncharacterized protein LOC130934121 [Arachis stenosperma]|uniref:uncharacterized protein LOC130934121 n=1 Tax=Arachis stenosperma TaxID=217475 RepID=UPI0025AD1F84|nr:uncharacterized protein LOC130934121 [Arachis stenosperma]
MVFKDEVRANIKNQGETIKRLVSQVGYLSQQIPKPTDGFLSDTEKNPRGETRKVRWEECKMITTSDERSMEEVEHLQDSPKENHEERNHAPQPTLREELKKREILNPYAPFPQRLKGGVVGRMYSRFLDMFASLDVNIPFINALQQMPSYIKYIKELLPKKSSLKGGQTIKMNRECSAIIQTGPPTKKKDPGSFHIPCAIGETMIDKGLCDLGAIGVVENVLVKVGNYFLPTNFVILEMEENPLHPIILGRPFLATARALIDMERRELVLRIHDEQLTFNVFKPSQEANHDNKESEEEHKKELMKEPNKGTQVPHLKTPLVITSVIRRSNNQV